MNSLEQIKQTHRRLVQENPADYSTGVLQEELEALEDDISDFFDDPMTQSCGCSDEISYDMRIKGSAIFSELCKRGVEEFDGDCMTESRWCPTRRP